MKNLNLLLFKIPIVCFYDTFFVIYLKEKMIIFFILMIVDQSYQANIFKIIF